MSQLEAFATLRKPAVQLANLTVGTVAQSVIFGNAPADRNGTTTTGSPVIASVANTQGLVPGMQIASANIPQNSFIVSIVPNTSVTINQNATANGAVLHTFGVFGGGQIARIRISNLSTTIPVAVNFSDAVVVSAPAVQSTTATSSTSRPTYTLSTMTSSTSTAIAAGDGIRIQPGTTLELNLSLDTRLWLIANAASAPVQVACILQNG
jgi:hypothetical protein